MSRIDPKNRQEAFAHQFEDCAKTLMPLALQEDPKGFDQQISVIEGYIKAYRSKRLINMCDKAVKKTKERDEYMKKHNPSLYELMNETKPKRKMISEKEAKKYLKNKKR